MDNTGSFGAAAGGISPELHDAISRRGQGGATAAVTQGAPGFNPATQPPAPATGGAPMPTPVPTPTPPGASAQPAPAPTDGSPLPFAGQDAIKVIDALSKFLKTFSQPGV